MTAGLSAWRPLNREPSRFLLLLLAALFLRVGVLWKFGESLAEDRDNYRGIALHLAAGDGFVDPETLTSTAYRPPLYPLVMAGIFYCGGTNMALGIVQLALGVATVGLTVLCGRRLELGRAGRLAAGLLVAVDPLLLQQTALVMTEALATFLAALLLWLCLGPQTTMRNLSLGIAFGLCCLCRPTFWAFGAFASASWLLSLTARCPVDGNLGPTSKRASRRRQALCVVAGVILAVAPWGIRNAMAFGRPIITTTHGGYTLLLAHNPAYTRNIVEQRWGAVWKEKPLEEWKASIEVEMAQEVPPLDYAHLSPAVELARDTWMNHKARAYIRDNPLIALRAGLTLLGRMWNVAHPWRPRNCRQLPAIRLAIGVVLRPCSSGNAGRRRAPHACRQGGLVARRRARRQFHGHARHLLGRHAHANAARPGDRPVGRGQLGQTSIEKGGLAPNAGATGSPFSISDTPALKLFEILFPEPIDEHPLTFGFAVVLAHRHETRQFLNGEKRKTQTGVAGPVCPIGL